MTRPVLMKNSVCTAGFSHAGVPMVLLIRSPSSSAKMTYSMPKFTNVPLPARNRAKKARPKITGSPIRNGTTRAPISAIPIAPTTRKPSPTYSTFDRLLQANTRSGARCRVAANLGAERTGESTAAKRRQLACGTFDRLAVTARERFAETLAQADDVCLLVRLGIARDPVERIDPARRLRRDLAVGGPAEGRHDIAQVERFPLEDQQHRGDDQEAEDDGDPVFGAPLARYGRRLAGGADRHRAD